MAELSHVEQQMESALSQLSEARYCLDEFTEKTQKGAELAISWNNMDTCTTTQDPKVYAAVERHLREEMRNCKQALLKAATALLDEECALDTGAEKYKKT